MSPGGSTAWVHEFSTADLVTYFGFPTYQRGLAYSRQDRIDTVSTAGTMITAHVEGSGDNRYFVIVHYRSHRGPTLETTCTCPVHERCKHAAALVLHVQRRGDEPALPEWRRLLAPVLDEARQVQPSTDAGPLAVQFESSGHGTTLLRPMKWGRSGRWIRTGIDWDMLDSPYETASMNPDHRAALSRLRRALDEGPSQPSYWRGQSTLPLGAAGPSVWQALRAVAQAGVELLSAPGTPPVRLLPDVDLATRVSTGPDGSLRLTTRVHVDSAPLRLHFNQLVGAPPHGFVVRTPAELLLAGFSSAPGASVVRLALSSPELEVPAGDVADFAATVYPALARLGHVLLDDDVDLPLPEGPWLLLTLTPTARDRLLLQPAMRYLVGARTVDLTPHVRAQDPPLRDHGAESDLLASLPAGPWQQHGRPGDEPAVLHGLALFEFLRDTLPVLRERDDVIVVIDGDLPDVREAVDDPVIELRVTDGADGSRDWFNLAIEVTIEDESVPFHELFSALARGEDYFVLESGTWFSLDRPELDRLRTLIEESRALTDSDDHELRLRPEHAGLWEELTSLGVVAEQSAAWRSSVDALLDVAALPATPVPDSVQATLRPYQETGFRWLSNLWQSRLGGILADDMGLGKTVQALTLLAWAKDRGELGEPALVVAPTSVVGNWAVEAARFTPGLRVLTMHQTSRKRRAPLAEEIAGADLVVSSYALVRLDAEEYAAQRWSGVLLDEAQFVKNRQSRSYAAVRRLPARVKIAITGTPLENNLMDLWSLLSITAPGLFADPHVFAELYRTPIETDGDPTALQRLQRRTRPLILRRTKELVERDLPPKQEQVLAVELSPAHRRVYDRYLARERQKVLRLVGDLNQHRITILRSLTLLRQLSLAPALVDDQHSQIASSKLEVLLERLQEVVAEGHRALVFSQFTQFLGLARDQLTAAGISSVYLDGRTRRRDERIRQFRDGDDPVFLISLKAGGFGLTLTEADYVFILDPWWNPAAEAQAVDRTHRIGQDKHVMVYRLVAADTIEEKVVALQQHKRDLFDKVVGDASDLAAPLSADDIRGLLDL